MDNIGLYTCKSNDEQPHNKTFEWLEIVEHVVRVSKREVLNSEWRSVSQIRIVMSPCLFCASVTI